MKKKEKNLIKKCRKKQIKLGLAGSIKWEELEEREEALREEMEGVADSPPENLNERMVAMKKELFQM